MTCKHCIQLKGWTMDTKGNIVEVDVKAEITNIEPFDYTYCECDCHY
jgi:hypothetical protein